MFDKQVRLGPYFLTLGTLLNEIAWVNNFNPSGISDSVVLTNSKRY